MKVVTINQIEKEPFTLPLFTSPDVTRQVFLPESKEYEVNRVNFGKGIIATEEEEKVISAGDVVFIPANEVHWHGAAADFEFSHIYSNSTQTKLTQHED